MIKVNHICLLLFVIVISVASVFSQGVSSIQLGGALPQSDFGDLDMNNSKAGGAGLGANLGFRYDHSLGIAGLGVFGSVNLMYNDISSEALKNIEKSPFVDVADDVFYFNVPFSAGVSYKHEIFSLLAVQGDFGVLVNFMKPSDASTTLNGETTTTVWSPGYSTGFKVGAALIINEKFSINFDYFSLGKVKLEGEQDSPIGSFDVEQELPVDVLTIGVGILF